MSPPSIVWFRQDLRVADQAALATAAREGPIIPVYILDDETPPARYKIGGAQRWWLHGSLHNLSDGLEALGSKLLLRKGRSETELVRLLEETGARTIHAIGLAEPWWRKAEERVGHRLTLHYGDSLVPPRRVLSGEGRPYRIYSAYWRALQSQLPSPPPEPSPDRVSAPSQWPASDRLEDWALRPSRPNWASGFDMKPGEIEARARLRCFADRAETYAHARDLPSSDATSQLSAHLHFGEISPSTVLHGLAGSNDIEKFLRELAWRDFARGLIIALPNYADTNGNPKFDRLQWRTGHEAAQDLQAWQQGRTGYPIVDAGMRELWVTGRMHNRVRMITASFLVKHLLIDWRRGWDWFWDTLVDADYANNSVNWQWVAGTGIDANMFGRIMAPLVQSEKFDAGFYIRRWVPELAGLDDAAIHDPGPVNGYPQKIIGHREGRERALAALRDLNISA